MKLQQPGSSFQDIEDLDWQSQFGTASASLGVLLLGGVGGCQPREKWIFHQQNADSANGKQRFGMIRVLEVHMNNHEDRSSKNSGFNLEIFSGDYTQK